MLVRTQIMMIWICISQGITLRTQEVRATLVACLSRKSVSTVAEQSKQDTIAMIAILQAHRQHTRHPGATQQLVKLLALQGNTKEDM